jgi:drug/metabolite transporter (DMT)-like permease
MSPPAAHASPSTATTSADAARRLTGLACGMGAGALWGLVFLAPALVSDFSPLMLAVGRHLCFGLIALALALPRWQALTAGLSSSRLQQLFWLALAGNTLYYVLLSSAVQHGGIAMTSLVVGFMPVAVTLIGSRDQGAVPLARLLPSLLLCVIGAVCIGWQALDGPHTTHWGTALWGLLCAVGALVAWTAYAVGNARALQGAHSPSAHDWNLLIGLMTGVQCLVLLPLALMLGGDQHTAEAWWRFGAVSVGVAVLASVLGNALWNRMSQLLPLTLVGQMILFETLFALLYGFVWEARMPHALEVVALVCVVLSVALCLKAHQAPRQTPE